MVVRPYFYIRENTMEDDSNWGNGPMQTLYSSLKVNNEIELCEVLDMDCKKLIEKELLQNRISYFVRWQKRGFLGRREVCVICVNENAVDAAADIVEKMCEETGYDIRFLMKKSKNNYL